MTKMTIGTGTTEPAITNTNPTKTIANIQNRQGEPEPGANKRKFRGPRLKTPKEKNPEKKPF